MLYEVITNVEEAIGHFTVLLKTRSEFADVHYMLGILSDRQGDIV